MSIHRSSRVRLGLAATAVASVLVLSACAVAGKYGPMPTENDFAAIQPGWTSQQVLTRFGPPTWTFGVYQDHMTIWNYRYNRSDCTIYQVSLLPDGVVRDAGTGWDPACDGPSKQ